MHIYVPWWPYHDDPCMVFAEKIGLINESVEQVNQQTLRRDKVDTMTFAKWQL